MYKNTRKGVLPGGGGGGPYSIPQPNIDLHDFFSISYPPLHPLSIMTFIKNVGSR